MADNYVVIAEGNGLVNGLENALRVRMHPQGDLLVSSQLWDQIKARQEGSTYFRDFRDLARARSNGFSGPWNMSKASVLSVQFTSGEVPQLEIGYALMIKNPRGGESMRVDYASAAVSRSELPHFDSNPLDMYELYNGIYQKKHNDHVNALGNLILVVLDCDSGKKPEDMDVLLMRRGNLIDYLSGTWTAFTSYSEPENRRLIDAEFLQSMAVSQAEKKGGIRKDELRIVVPAGFVQGNVETVMAYVAFSPLSKEAALSRIPSTLGEERVAVPVREYDAFIAARREGSGRIESESLGALEGILGSRKLLDKYVIPFVSRR